MAESKDTEEGRALVPFEAGKTPAPTRASKKTKSSQQEQVFVTALKDEQLWSRFLLIASAFGILLILGSLAEVASGNITLAIAQGIIGAVINGIIRLIQNPRREVREQMNAVYDKIVEEERFNAAIELAATIEGRSTRNRVTETIIEQLIRSEANKQEVSKQLPKGEQNNSTTNKSIIQKPTSKRKKSYYRSKRR